MKFSLVIPAKNEEKRIPATLGALCRYIVDNTNLSQDEIEVIVVVNNSDDQTYEIVNIFKTHYPFIKAFNIDKAIGKGGAIRYGFEKAKGEYIGFVDADMSSSPIEVFKLLNRLEKSADAAGAIADRYCKKGVIVGKVPISRRVFSLGFRVLARILFGLKYHDTQCGLKIFRKDAGKFLMKENEVNGWTFDLNVLLIANMYDLNILSVPTVWQYRSDSKLNTKKAMRSVPVEVFDAFLKYKVKPAIPFSSGMYSHKNA